MESFFKRKETDCILYSQDGVKFNIHREILYQTKFLRNILLNVQNVCCGKTEILCPSSEDELESIVNFLYNGKIYLGQQMNLSKILYNLKNIFGFNDELQFTEYKDEEFVSVQSSNTGHFFQESHKIHPLNSQPKFENLEIS